MATTDADPAPLDPALLDRAYHHIMASIVETTQAPHHTELAGAMEVDVETGRRLVHELVGMTPGWVHPGTDYLASFPPFNLQPTHYRITIDDRHGWFGQ